MASHFLTITRVAFLEAGDAVLYFRCTCPTYGQCDSRTGPAGPQAAYDQAVKTFKNHVAVARAGEART